MGLVGARDERPPLLAVFGCWAQRFRSVLAGRQIDGPKKESAQLSQARSERDQLRRQADARTLSFYPSEAKPLAGEPISRWLDRSIYASLSPLTAVA